MSFVTYTSYLKLDELLSLQQPLSQPEEHDERLFIVIHQVYELWFSQLLHEFDHACASLDANAHARVMHTFQRVRAILKTVVAQIDVLETMTPRSFASFRGRLQSASGFQSVQFREIEFLMGKKDHAKLQHHAAQSPALAQLQARLAGRTLYDALLAFLARRGHSIPPEALARDVAQPLAPNAGVQDALVKVYLGDETAAALCESLVDIDEGLAEWRYRHVMMVQRTIGARMGTGGSMGAEYLRTTLFKPFFEDLWAIRDRF